MRILVNATPTHGARSGVGHYIAELLRCLRPQLLSGEECVPWPGSWMAWLKGRLQKPGAAAGFGSGGRRASAVSRLVKPVGRFVLRQYLRSVAWSGGYDVYHEPNFIPAPCGTPTIATIHDLSVLLHPEWHPIDRVRWFERHFPSVARRCVHFLAISESARREIIQVLGIPPNRITRTYMGVRHGLRPMTRDETTPVLRSLGLPESYLLCVGTIEPRKNILMLLHAYCDLPTPIRERCPLVLAGGWGWNADEVAEFFNDTARHRQVMRLGYVPDSAMSGLYNGARALVFPSWYEGFGMPPVEMQACGGAVLASTASAVAETAHGPAHLIDPRDSAGWREAMQRVILDDDWHATLCHGSTAHARAFTWDACAADTLRVYRHVSAGRFDCAPTDIGTPRAA